MATIPKSFIEQLLASTTIVDVIQRSVPLKKKGANYSGCCPFHQEKTPSFTVSESKQFYYCFGCGASGDVIKFLTEHERLTFVEAIEQLAREAGLEVPTEKNDVAFQHRKQLFAVLEQANHYYQRQLRDHSESNSAIDYLKQRGLTGKIAKQFGIGFAPTGWHNLSESLTNVDDGTLLAAGLLVDNDKGNRYDRFRNRIMFPIRDKQGRTIGFGGRVLDDSVPKYLNSPETEVFHKGAELYGLYEAQLAKSLQPLIIVEGYMDVIALHQYGIYHCVATLGTATTKQNAERLFRISSQLIFCFDGDKAGVTAAWRALETLLPLLEDGRQVSFMFLSEGDDPDALLHREGQQAFLQKMEHAEPLSETLINHLAADSDTTTIDGQASLVQHTKTYLTKIPGNIFKQLVINQLAQKIAVSDQQLRSWLGLKFDRQPDVETRAHDVPSSNYSFIQQLISLLLQQPDLCSTVETDTRFQQLSLKGVETIKTIIELAKHTHSISAAAIIAHFESQKVKDRLATLAMAHVLPEHQDSQQYLDALLNRLNDEQQQQQELEWQQKLQAGNLTQDERQHYQAFLTQRRKK